MKPSVVQFRKEGHDGPTVEQWDQARLKAVTNEAKFAVMVCEDADGRLFHVPVNVESDLHLKAMVEESLAVFDEDADE